MRMRPQAQVRLPREAGESDGATSHIDYPLLVASLALLGMGMVMVASASLATAAGEEGAPFHYFIRHCAYAGGGIVAALIAACLPLSVWTRLAPWLLAAGTVLLALVLIPGIGHEVNGSRRWLRLGPLTVQPSEPMKLCVILYLAGFLGRRRGEDRGSLAVFLKPVGILLLISALIVLESDYGTTAVLLATAFGMLFLGGTPLIVCLGPALAAGAGLAALALNESYVMDRLLSFTDPWADPFGSGFQLTQAQIAIGRGGWLGVGLGEGVQKLFYLPEAHNDFLFAVLAEELGFGGVVAVIALFLFVCLRSIGIGGKAEAAGRPYGAHIAYGIGLLVAIQAFFNIGVNLGVLPTKGLPLPLVSYGGSSMVVTCAGIGLVLRVALESRRGR